MAQTAMSERTFEYRPQWAIIIATVVFFALCGIGLGVEAASNRRGLLLEGFIELSPEHATVFYWVLSGLSFLFVLLGVGLAYIRVLSPQKLVLGDDGLHAPKWAWSRELTFIRYADITSMASQRVKRSEFLRIGYAGGKQTINASMLGSKAVYKEFCDELQRRVQSSRTPAGG